MKVLPGVGVAELQGTFQGVTAQRWRGLLIFRKKPTPHQANSPRQQIVKALFGLLSSAWRNDLTQGLRRAWNNLAANKPWLDVFGREITMTGENLYIKQNIILLDAGRPRNDQPVPGTIPPDLSTTVFQAIDNIIEAIIPGQPVGIISAQDTFINVSIAGFPDEVRFVDPPPNTLVDVDTYGLSQGRVHQVSDFRHAFYVNDVDDALPGQEVIIHQNLEALVGTKRNFVMSIQRFNKYGNFSVPILYSAIVETV